MSFEKASFSKEPIKPTQEMLNINLEKELHWVLNKELSEKEEILKWETKEKKDILNKEYLSYTIWKHLTLSSIWLNNDISYKINWKEIEINNEVFTLPVELNDELIISWIEDYFKEEYFRDHLWEKNIVEYTVNNLLIDELCTHCTHRLYWMSSVCVSIKFQQQTHNLETQNASNTSTSSRSKKLIILNT